MSELMGLLQMHQLTDCLDCASLLERESIYDPFLKTEVKAKDFFQQRQTGLLFYVKEAYQKRVEQSEGDERVDDLIDYCEFLCNEHSDFYLALKLIQRARLHPLNLMERVRLSALEQFIEAQSEKLNLTLYEGTLELEHIIEAEDDFALVEAGVMQYVAHSLSLWKSLGSPQKMLQSELRAALKWQ